MKKNIVFIMLFVLLFFVISCQKTGVKTTTTVHYYLENLDNGEYTLKESNEIDSIVGEEISIEPKNEQGFHLNAGISILSGKATKDESFKFYVYYDRNVYDVKFFDGTTLIQNAEMKYGSTLEKPTDLVKKGQIFLGWSLNNLPYDFTTTISEDLTLLAQWKEIDSFSITLVLNNEEEEVVKEYSLNDLIIEPQGLTNGDKVLSGWFANPLYEGNPWNFELDTVKTNMTLYARWSTETTVTASYTADSNSSMTEGNNNAESINLDSDIFNVENFKSTNHVGLISSDGTIRIYRPDPRSSQHNILRISIHDSFVITGVSITFGLEKGAMKLTFGGEEFTVRDYGNQITYNNLSVNSFEVTNINVNPDPRTFIKSIVITYIQVGPDSERESDINRPVFEINDENSLVELLVNEIFVAPNLTATDVEDGPVTVHLDSATLPDTGKTGIYYVWYFATDSDNHQTKAYITVIVRESLYVYTGTDNLKGEALKERLNIIINTGFNNQTYATARQALEVADRDPHNFKNVLLIYDRDSAKGVWDHPIWEREHVWPNSMLGIDRVKNEQANIGSDLHNLRAIRPYVNQTRSNYYFVEPANPGDGFGVVGDQTYYPGDDDRGDVARIIFYMNTMWKLEIREDINMLVKWHLADPVDNFEIIRNEVIYGYQGNRNPYIDFPEFVGEVYGTNNAEIEFNMPQSTFVYMIFEQNHV